MALTTAERSSGTIGLITLGEKCAGARSAGNPHAACEVAGAGNELTEWLVRHSQRKRGETDRPVLRSIAPVLDPTSRRGASVIHLIYFMETGSFFTDYGHIERLSNQDIFD